MRACTDVVCVGAPIYAPESTSEQLRAELLRHTDEVRYLSATDPRRKRGPLLLRANRNRRTRPITRELSTKHKTHVCHSPTVEVMPISLGYRIGSFLLQNGFFEHQTPMHRPGSAEGFKRTSQATQVFSQRSVGRQVRLTLGRNRPVRDA
jgi:hypothetical protein